MKSLDYVIIITKGICDMIMTRESDYAVRILRALSGGEKLNVGQICDVELVPIQFAYKILKKLHRGGYVDVFRGVGGGCRLAVDLDKVSLYDLLVCINENIFVNACMAPDYKCPRRDALCGECRFHSNLSELQQKFEEELKSRSIASMFK